ncbi:MAG: class I SAM-dependent methyltransferase [Nitrospirae bacterium]|nr:class I SAM-dependent methyltransferase [Nitrospirota bacterium]
MKNDTISLLQSPTTGLELKLESSTLPDGRIIEQLVSQQAEQFVIANDIAIFYEMEKLTGLNKKYQLFYDKINWYYDLGGKIVMYILHGGEENVRREYLKELEIKDDSKVLEVSVGSGANLQFMPKAPKYYGLDIAMKMMRRCQKNAVKWGLDLELFYANAEALPFKNNSFDVVFHVGGINYFNNKKAAIDEMIRVAKPGTKMIIVDETEQLAKAASRIIPGAANYYRRDKPIEPPIDLVPDDMLEKDVKLTANGDLYCLSFRKP